MPSRKPCASSSIATVSVASADALGLSLHFRHARAGRGHTHAEIPKALHPFVLLPPLETKTRYEPGDFLVFDLTLIGRGSDFLPYFLYTFEQLGAWRGIGRERGRFAVESALWFGPEGREVPIYRGDDKVLHSAFHPVTIHFAIPRAQLPRHVDLCDPGTHRLPQPWIFMS